MSRTAKLSAFGGAALILGGVTWLWGVRGVAILLDYAFVGCL
jgi:hypothetical protein